MMTYKDRAYCSTKQNKCGNTKCSRHLETTDIYYTLTRNTKNLPLSMTDFSNCCEEFRIRESHKCVKSKIF